jgi:pimeloyl-ACP methyl ester carboxylesterase
MGAEVANRFRAAHPDRLLSCVFGGGLALRSENPFVAHASEYADALLEGDLGPIIGALAPPGQTMPAREELDARFEEMSSRNDIHALAAALIGQGFADSLDELGTNTVPSLALIGENDAIKVEVDAIAPVMANVEVVVIPGANHRAALGDSMFLEETLEFLARHQQPASDN